MASPTGYIITAHGSRTESTSKHALVEGLTLATSGGVTLLEDARLAIQLGRRYALVGPNGSGKSTLLQAVADRAMPGWPSSMTTALVSQDVVPLASSLVDNLFKARAFAQHRPALEAERNALEAELDTPSDAGAAAAADGLSSIGAKAHRLGELHELLEGMAGPQAERDARAILSGLQFPDADALATRLSGGWRQRLALAQALFVRHDVLLLDEPTNQ